LRNPFEARRSIASGKLFFDRCSKLIFQLHSLSDRFPSLLAQKVVLSFHFRAKSINPEPIRVRTDQLLQQLAVDPVILGSTGIKRVAIAGQGLRIDGEDVTGRSVFFGEGNSFRIQHQPTIAFRRSYSQAFTSSFQALRYC
jgi:hypothetical protein